MKFLRLASVAGAILPVTFVLGDIEAQRQKCLRHEDDVPARKAFDLNATFLPILEGTAFSELGPQVLSTDPWVVFFDTFMSEEEVAAIETHMFAQSFFPSPAGSGRSGHGHARHSETAFCTGECDQHAVVQGVRKRAGDVVGVPPGNFDFSQALRYKEGMYYRQHHDNHPTFHFLPSGARIFTYFVYLSDKDLEGGGTRFPQLGVTARAKRGSAVLFVNTMDRNPMETDPRTMHESVEVTQGEKRGMNMWLYQYDFRRAWQKGCTAISLADELGAYGKAASPVQPTVTIENGAQKAGLHVFLMKRDRAYDPNTTGPYLGVAAPGKSFTVESVEGDVLLIRTAKTGGKLLKEYSVRGTAKQVLRIGKKKPSGEL
eukprot:TRINITY_DN49907_c0_g1_i1.p1 TRINITY_DN49907_c0_g1~~TRINITY_DN49907_c0_g1_i1.p1  ORF type:complete len:373 (+),score=51.18 TRINITY_DN49907_c0_g1_i1:125-1243(+)